MPGSKNEVDVVRFCEGGNFHVGLTFSIFMVRKMGVSTAGIVLAYAGVSSLNCMWGYYSHGILRFTG